MSDAAAKPAFPAMSIAQAHAILAQPGNMLEVGEETIRGVKMKVWKNAPPTLRHLFDLAAGFAPRDHLVLDDERATVRVRSKAAPVFGDSRARDFGGGAAGLVRSDAHRRSPRRAQRRRPSAGARSSRATRRS